MATIYTGSTSPILAKQIFPCVIGLGFSIVLSECHFVSAHDQIRIHQLVFKNERLNRTEKGLQFAKVFSIKFPPVLIHQTFLPSTFFTIQCLLSPIIRQVMFKIFNLNNEIGIKHPKSTQTSQRSKNYTWKQIKLLLQNEKILKYLLSLFWLPLANISYYLPVHEQIKATWVITSSCPETLYSLQS